MATTGRPTKYKPEYCEMLIEHMANGLSFESFAGLISVNLDTLYEWDKVQTAFSEAKKAGFEANRLFYERAGVQQVLTGQGSATALIFNLKNRFPKQWRDKQEVDTTHTINGTPQVQVYIPQNQRDGG